MSTYREELCNKDERGIPLFSPLCKPGRTVDTSISHQVLRRPQEGSNGDYCHVAPVQYPNPEVPQINDSISAKDWFKDPTFAQTSAYRLKTGTFGQPNVHPALADYHKVKEMEKIAIGLLTTVTDS